MSKKFREARLMKKIKLGQAAMLLEVTQPTLSSWEAERKSPSYNHLLRMADLYEVTTDYLLGRESDSVISASMPYPKEALPILHGKPVWVPEFGWGLVNAIDNIILLTNGEHLKLNETDNLMPAAERFSEPALPHGKIIRHKDLKLHEEVWIEPISKDPALRDELRGWYQVKGQFAENESGNRFTLNTYGAKWLAFDAGIE